MLAAALTLAAACSNEISLLCPDKKGEELTECLARYAGSATPECRARLAGIKPKGPPEKVWGSEASSSGGGTGPAFEVQIKAEPEDSPVKGFDLVVQETPQPYRVTGETPAQIAASMGGVDIRDGMDGTKGAAATGARLVAHYTRGPKDGGCALAAAALTLMVTQKLPEWDAPPGASPETREWWVKAMSAIVKHEDGHKRIDADSGNAALRYLKQLGTLSSCEQLDNAVSGELHRANTEAMQKNIAWDLQTGHGRTQYEEAFGKPR